MSDINIDDLQREISAAESYLKRVPASAARGSSQDESRQGQSIMGSDVHVVAPPSAESSSISGGGVVPEKIGTDIMELNRILLRTQREEIEKERQMKAEKAKARQDKEAAERKEIEKEERKRKAEEEKPNLDEVTGQREKKPRMETEDTERKVSDLSEFEAFFSAGASLPGSGVGMRSSNVL